MRKNLLIICIFNLVALFSYSQVYKGQMEYSKIPVPAAHYQQEYTFDTTVNSEAWSTQQKGLNVSFASTDELFFRSEVPEVQKSLTWKATGWKGERLNIQVLVWAPDTLNQVRFLLNDLKNGNGKSIS